jgi:hypothetical protein
VVRALGQAGISVPSLQLGLKLVIEPPAAMKPQDSEQLSHSIEVFQQPGFLRAECLGVQRSIGIAPPRGRWQPAGQPDHDARSKSIPAATLQRCEMN